MSAATMSIVQALAVARGDAARLDRFIDRRERFLDALDWSLLSEAHARESAMLDDLLAGDAADAVLYANWLEERAFNGVVAVPGVLRFDPRPRPWHAEWLTLAA